MYLTIKPNSGVPLGYQISQQIKLAVATGRLAPGERLPTAREFAETLKVNFHTVRKAYGELEREGVLLVSRGRGTFVAEGMSGGGAAEARAMVKNSLETLMADLANMNISAEKIQTIMNREMEKLFGKKQGRGEQ